MNLRLGNACPARGLGILVLSAALALPAAAQQIDKQKEHIVKKGDTLWDLSRFYFNDPFHWSAIYDANRKVVKDPHWIYPTEKLIIPGLKDTTVVAVEADKAPNRSLFYRPDTVVAPPQSERLRLGPVQPMEWLAAPWIADTLQLGKRARVYKPYEPRDQNDKLGQMFHPHDKIYVSVLDKSLKAGDQLLVYQKGDYVPGYGTVIQPVGVVQIDSMGPNTALATITTQFDELKVGDAAIALPAIPTMPGEKMIDVTGGPQGTIIDFLLDQPLYDNTDYGFVNLGGAKGLTVGDELLAFIPPHKPSSKYAEMLPEEPVGRLRVIRVTDQTVTVRITRLSNAAMKKGLPVRVARKAQ